jgi:hypothetical protein
MVLKRRQTIAKRTPINAKTSIVIAIGRRILFKTISGLPSGGVPSVDNMQGIIIITHELCAIIKGTLTIILSPSILLVMPCQ